MYMYVAPQLFRVHLVIQQVSLLKACERNLGLSPKEKVALWYIIVCNYVNTSVLVLMQCTSVANSTCRKGSEVQHTKEAWGEPCNYLYSILTHTST